MDICVGDSERLTQTLPVLTWRKAGSDVVDIWDSERDWGRIKGTDVVDIEEKEREGGREGETGALDGPML